MIVRKITELTDAEIETLLKDKLILTTWTNTNAQEFKIVIKRDSGWNNYYITGHDPFKLNRLLNEFGIDVYCA